MIVEFRCEREHVRLWMYRELLAMKSRGVRVQIAWTTTVRPRPAGLEALFELERMMLRKGKPGGADKLEVSKELLQARAGDPDVVIDFTGGDRDLNCPARLYLRPLFNGGAGENAALAAILAGDLPVIEIIN